MTRTHQKERTRAAIVAAARELVESGAPVTMPAIAAAARVSEATAYRYFPDLVSLQRETALAAWPEPSVAMAAVAHSADPADRVAHAARELAQRVLRYEPAVRAVVAASVTSPDAAAARPAHRFGLIEEALAPFADAWDAQEPGRRERLVQDLAVVVSAEALFTLTDLCGLGAEEATAALVRIARSLTEAALAR